MQTIRGGDPVVLVVGDLENDDALQFVYKVVPLDNALVSFWGPGGDGGVAMDLGLSIRAKRFATV